ncbi:hypothetical protein BVER_04521 [Candidatus Burkholderia verschuerenii]|uniref:Pilus formation protein N-terminal domain-containing protein n=1 Tax=Candidatus Burkholderia verschuerenii TaxID=242163 RepID=A0A0L0MC78_9BURK|nr:hypothetical protein BVER_04521 [Candidatus Burkholderia verschuerenii]
MNTQFFSRLKPTLPLAAAVLAIVCAGLGGANFAVAADAPPVVDVPPPRTGAGIVATPKSGSANNAGVTTDSSQGALTLDAGKGSMLHLPEDAASVFVADPAVADV